MVSNKWIWIGWLFAIFSSGVFIYLWQWVSRYDHVDPPREHSEAGIVLGAALWNQQPSPALKERLNLALKLYRENIVNYLILSGGLGNNGITEAEGMKNYLVERGVSPAHLILEDQSSNTKENLLYSKKILEKHQWKNITIITHDYHMVRALDYARQAGIYATGSPVHSKVLFLPYHKTRECLALIKQKVFRN
ncbi:YdcF family protein [Thermoactinomyces mirandus]|uniref:YdcF family protein n=1 Tax=Thermoactinomyces mirandus TaxID=2756294 RepID=A0A7W1XSD3_9BACL|nr:YdcF family protein [Thermoactinomyces mirandus]MBA4602267.1 YdcF family protein [Thermoactinomyces mirandus]